MKKIILFCLLGVFICSTAFADSVPPPDKSWTVEERMGRVFYFTRGRIVWGHEFGFFKDLGYCNEDTFWLSISSYEDEVQAFDGKDIEFELEIDKEHYSVKIPMMSVGKLASNNIMLFTNLSLDNEATDALRKGSVVNLRVVGPKELLDFFDIKEDEFDLKELIDAQQKAFDVCVEKSPKRESNEEMLVVACGGKK